MSRLRCTIPLLALILAAGGMHASPLTIDFEGLPDSIVLTNQYPGLTLPTPGESINQSPNPATLPDIPESPQPEVGHTSMEQAG